MKKIIYTLAITMFVAGAILSSCNSTDKNVENAKLKVEDAKADVVDAQQNLTEAKQGAEVSDFQEFKNESNKEINNNERRIAELRIEMKSESRDTREKDEAKVDALEKRNNELKGKLEAYNDDGKSDWKEFKTEFKHDLEGLGMAFKNITVRNTH